MICFETREQALAYQLKNPEGRILFDKGECKVWLPICSSMKYLRSSSLGMVIIFESKDTAKAWAQRSILGEEMSSGEEVGVSISRDWSFKELQKLIGHFSTSLKPPIHNQKPISRAVSKERERVSFQVEPSTGSSYQKAPATKTKG